MKQNDKLDWFQQVSKGRRKQKEEAEEAEDRINDNGDDYTTPDSYMLRCPKCDVQKDVTKRYTLLKGMDWANIPCVTCSTTRVASVWLCECQVKWQHCVGHREEGLRWNSIAKVIATNVKRKQDSANATRGGEMLLEAEGEMELTTDTTLPHEGPN